jgi:hypothetical protein
MTKEDEAKFNLVVGRVLIPIGILGFLWAAIGFYAMVAGFFLYVLLIGAVSVNAGLNQQKGENDNPN